MTIRQAENYKKASRICKFIRDKISRKLGEKLMDIVWNNYEKHV